MSTTDHSHRDDFNLTDVEAADAYDLPPPIVQPVVSNTEAEQAAKAQRAAAAPMPVVAGQRSFADDLPPPMEPRREYTVGGGTDGPAASSTPPLPADDDDAAAVPTGANERGGAWRGPPAPVFREGGGEASWAARVQWQAHVLAEDSERAADWLASPYAAVNTLDSGEDGWSSWRP